MTIEHLFIYSLTEKNDIKKKIQIAKLFKIVIILHCFYCNFDYIDSVLVSKTFQIGL